MLKSFLLIAALGALAGCDRDAPPAPPEPPSFSEAFPAVTIPAGAKLVSRTGSVDALQLTLTTTAAAEQLADVYRDDFSKPGWKLVSDTRGPDSTVVLLGENGPHSIWVRITPTPSGAALQLTGVVPERDSAYQAIRRAVRDTTNTVVPRALPR